VIALAAMTLPAAAAAQKIAVIGLVHSHVWGHLERMLRQSSPKLVAIAESNPELIAEARKMGAPEELFVSDYRKMLDEARPDIVWAFVENNRHLEIVQACAPRRIHVLFEKPLAATFADAAAIRRLAEQHRIQVMTNYQMAWWPSNHAARREAASGTLGKVWRLRGIVGHGGPGSSGPRSKYFFEWLTDPVRNGGGALIDFGCYNALWSLWFLGRPEKVYAHVNHLRPEVFPKVEDNSTMILSYQDGVGLFEGSWDLPRSFQDLEIFGLKASLMVTRDGAELRSGREAPRALPLEALPPERAEPVAHMVHAIRTGEPLADLVSLEMNVQVVEILEAAKESVRTGRAVPLPPRR
jgi:predicted dehydrogenase